MSGATAGKQRKTSPNGRVRQHCRSVEAAAAAEAWSRVVAPRLRAAAQDGYAARRSGGRSASQDRGRRGDGAGGDASAWATERGLLDRLGGVQSLLSAAGPTSAWGATASSNGRGRDRSRSRSRRRAKADGPNHSSSSSRSSSPPSTRASPRCPGVDEVEATTLKLCEAAARYEPLAKCLERLDHLWRRRGRRKARRSLALLVFRLAQVPAGLTTGRPSAIRFVALSDTHTYHQCVHVPQGEVLLFLGDAVGNYGRHYDLVQHLQTFLEWLGVQCRRFRKVFFIAGNHETLLDEKSEKGGSNIGLEVLGRFLKATPNCTYLNNEPAQYRGLRLWGSPVTTSRLETDGKLYYSRAFERSARKRAKLWATVPDGLDVLMTHCPAWGPLCSKRFGDSLLASRLAEMRSPPRIHVCGHDHDFLGLASDARTVSLNVAQDEILRADPKGGGCALVFDLEARDNGAR